MTFKEWMIMDKPECVDDGYTGGVSSCPCHHGLEPKEESMKNCVAYGGEGCAYCWNREMLGNPKDEVFTKSDLKDGMVVKLRNKNRVLYINGFLSYSNGYINLEEYNEDLLSNTYPSFDICSIYKIDESHCLETILRDGLGLIELWRRKESTTFTVKEAEERLKELLGVEVKISDASE